MRITGGSIALLAACVLLAALGCAAQSDRATGGTPTADVSGLWEGGSSAGVRQSGDHRMTLRQDGDKVTGSAYLWATAGGRQDFLIEGTVVIGNEFHFQPARGESHTMRGHLVVRVTA
jgi:hypothetical protein